MSMRKDVHRVRRGQEADLHFGIACESGVDGKVQALSNEVLVGGDARNTACGQEVISQQEAQPRESGLATTNGAIGQRSMLLVETRVSKCYDRKRTSCRSRLHCLHLPSSIRASGAARSSRKHLHPLAQPIARRLSRTKPHSPVPSTLRMMIRVLHKSIDLST